MFVIQIIDADGEIRYVQVSAASAAEARNLAAAQAGLSPSERIGTVASRQFFESQNVTLPQNIQEITGATTTPGGGGGEDENKNLIPPTFPIEEDIERFEFGPAFERALRQGGVNIGAGGGLLGAQTRAAQQPLFSRFFGTEALRPGVVGTEQGELAATESEPSFQNFIAQNLQGGSLLGRQGAQQARDLLTQAQSFRDFSEGQLPSLLAGSFLNPATTGQGLNLANIAREAARTRFGSLSRFLPSAYDLSQSYLSQERPTRGTFADFLNQRIFG
jgi:hypothetical protein